MANISKDISDFFCRYGIIKKEEADIFKYGIDFFVISVLEVMSVIIISLFFKNFWYTLLYFFGFIPLRIYSGGYHADTKLRCYIILLFVYGIFTMLVKYISEAYILPLEIISIMLTAIMVLLSAPIVSNNKSINVIERNFYRKFSIYIMLIEFIIILFGMFMLHNSKSVLSFSLGQLSVSISMIAAIVKKKIGGVSDE